MTGVPVMPISGTMLPHGTSFSASTVVIPLAASMKLVCHSGVVTRPSASKV
jgi:hypothetical protein